MKPIFWSVLLQWSRFGVSAFVFLTATRFLSLQEFGAFATAFAAIKLTQGFHKAGISETIVIKTTSTLRLNALFALASIFGIIFAGAYLTFATWFGIDRTFLPLAIIPVFLGISATSDGLLRKQLNLRSLALRTSSSQLIAALVTFIALKLGAGAGALVIFALLSTVLSGTLSILLAGWYPTKLPQYKHIRFTLRTVLQIAGRDSLNSGIFPLVQILIGTCIGLPAAGAFQIATRIISMLDALTLAPLRYLTLPKLVVQKTNPAFVNEIHRSLKLSVHCACWVWFGLAASVPLVLNIIVGAQHATSVTPILQALIPLGLSAAFAMTFTQALMAHGMIKPILMRAVLTFGLSVLMTLILLVFDPTPTDIAIALSTTNLIVLLWFLNNASKRLSFSIFNYSSILPPICAGSVMFASIYQSALPFAGQITAGTLIYLLVLAVFPSKKRDMVINMKRAVIITGHFPVQKRQSSILWVSHHLQKMGWHVTHVTVGYSWLSYLKPDERLKALGYRPRRGQYDISSTLTALYGVSPIHPIKTGYRALDKIMGSLQCLFTQYWRNRLKTPLMTADLVICESGAPVLLAPSIAQFAANAARVYRVNDDIQLLNSPDFLLEVELKNAKFFTRISSANQTLLERFRHPKLTLDPMGVPKEILEGKGQSPFSADLNLKNAVCAGTTQLDYDAIFNIAKQRPNWDIHILGRTKKNRMLQLQNLHFHGELPFEDVVKFIEHADIGLAPYVDKTGIEYQTTNSNRMLLYRHFGLPILGPDRLRDPRIPNIIGYSDPNALDRCEVLPKRSEAIDDWAVLANRLTQNREMDPPTDVS